MPGRRCANKQRATQERSNGHVQQSIGERGVEHHGKPVHRYHDTVNDFIALRGLHPAVRRQDPEGRYYRSQRHHAGREEMQSRTDFIPAEEHHAQESCFEEECG
ncbi:hypothetical protein D3C80_1235240 [compost metagenome]